MTSTRTVTLVPTRRPGRGQGDRAARRRRDVLAGVPDADRGRPRDAAGHGRRPGPLPGRGPGPSCSTPDRGARPGTTTSPTATCPPAAAGPPRRTSASPSPARRRQAATVAIKFRAGAPRAPRPPTSVRAQAAGQRGPDHVAPARRQRGDHPPLRDHPLRRGEEDRGDVRRVAGLVHVERPQLERLVSVLGPGGQSGRYVGGGDLSGRPAADRQALGRDQQPDQRGTVQGHRADPDHGDPELVHQSSPIRTWTGASAPLHLRLRGSLGAVSSGTPAASPNGSYTIRVTAYDSYGRVATATRTVTVSNPTRKVTITSPSAGATSCPGGPTSVRYSFSPADLELVLGRALWSTSSGGSANAGSAIDASTRRRYGPRTAHAACPRLDERSTYRDAYRVGDVRRAVTVLTPADHDHHAQMNANRAT